MLYMMLMTTDPDAEKSWDRAKDAEMLGAWLAEVDGSGARLLGHRLRPPADATTVQVRGGELVVSDGPFAETKEWIAGFDLIEAPDLDTAIAIAGRHPVAHFGKVEIRPVMVE